MINMPFLPPSGDRGRARVASPRHVFIVLGAFTAAPLMYGAILFFPKIGVSTPPASIPLDTIFLLLSIPQVVIGYVVAFIFIAPKGWHRTPRGWEREESVHLEKVKPDTADSFLQRSHGFLIVSAALVEAAAILGLVSRVLGYPIAQSLWMIGVSFVALLFLFPRAVYVSRTYEELSALEAGRDGGA